MKYSILTRKLLNSTRGQVIMLLRQEPRTVADLASALKVTDNAIRSHIATLERDGLVHQSGERAGFRKPHLSYELTEEAGDLFPKIYDSILNQLIAVLKEQIGAGETEEILREVGRRLAPPGDGNTDSDFAERLQQATKKLEAIGGQAALEEAGDKVIIRGRTCPLSAATGDHGEVCKMVETLLSDIIGEPVRQICQRESSPQCCFEVQAPADKK